MITCDAVRARPSAFSGGVPHILKGRGNCHMNLNSGSRDLQMLVMKAVSMRVFVVAIGVLLTVGTAHAGTDEAAVAVDPRLGCSTVTGAPPIDIGEPENIDDFK